MSHVWSAGGRIAAGLALVTVHMFVWSVVQRAKKKVCRIAQLMDGADRSHVRLILLPETKLSICDVAPISFRERQSYSSHKLNGENSKKETEWREARERDCIWNRDIDLWLSCTAILSDCFQVSDDVIIQ
jgi:hypothetical protein